MRTLVVGALSALCLATGLNVVSISGANAQAPNCFRGDTMDRDGGPTGALGAPKCTVNFEGRSNAYALFQGQEQSMRSEYAPNARSYAPGYPYGPYFDRHYGPDADRTGS